MSPRRIPSPICMPKKDRCLPQSWSHLLPVSGCSEASAFLFTEQEGETEWPGVIPRAGTGLYAGGLAGNRWPILPYFCVIFGSGNS